MTDGPFSDRRVLAIESSCDETCAAIVRGREVEADVVASQTQMHADFGGVVPEIASRRHLELIDLTIDEVMQRAGIASIDELDAIAVTRGPGLIGALLVGVAAAKSRAYAADLPIVPVDHLVGHIASSLLASERPSPPYLCLLASGGHTMMLDVNEQFNITLLGTTRDDAAGEAFDKGARLLGLGMPGGPALSALAQSGDDRAAPFTPAMVHHDTLDTSFAGIKTALSVFVRDQPGVYTDADLAAGYQRVIVETLTASVRKAIAARGPRSGRVDARSVLTVVGGVAANATLRSSLQQICHENDVELVRTPLQWCGDNAAMIGVASNFTPALIGPDAREFDAYATSPLFSRGQFMPTEHL